MPIVLTGDTGVESPEIFLSGTISSVFTPTPLISLNSSGTVHSSEIGIYQGLDTDDIGLSFLTTFEGVRTEKLRITPAGTLWMLEDAQVISGVGSASSPSYGFMGSTHGMYSASTTQLAFSVAGTSRLRINTTAPYVEYFDGSVWQEVGSGSGGDFLPLAGGTMAGSIVMGTNYISMNSPSATINGSINIGSTGINEGIAFTDATGGTLRLFVDGSDGYLTRAGSLTTGIKLSSAGLLTAQAGLTTTAIIGTSLNLGSGNLNTVESIYLDSYIYSEGDTDTYMQFHAANQWRVVVGGRGKIKANTTNGILMFSAKVSGTLIIPVV